MIWKFKVERMRPVFAKKCSIGDVFPSTGTPEKELTGGDERREKDDGKGENLHQRKKGKKLKIRVFEPSTA
jgi:hypothetical protein